MHRQPQREIPESIDTLGETLYSLRLNGMIYAKSELTAPWGIEMPPMTGKMMFHIVTRGSCWLRVTGHPDIQLLPGELVLLPRGKGHYFSSTREQSCSPFFDIPVIKLSERFELIRYGGGGQETQLTCGVLSFDHLAGEKLIGELPPVIHLKRNDTAFSSHLHTLLALMAEEAASLGTGGETVVANLADIIVIQAIRHWIEHAPEARQGWLGALRDPKIGKALAAIHSHPESAWTVDSLAEQAGMSRSGFSARFSEVIGTSAKQYVTEWRMNLARIKIMQSPISLVDLAEELGYQSEAAFSRAYKRVIGVPPLRPKSGES